MTGARPESNENLHDLARKSPLLQALVRAAARIGSATSASLFLTDQENDDLVLVIAIGPSADAVQGLRLPLGHGIAGLVAATGQPLVVSDAGNDPRQAREIAQTAGYIPHNIACVPVDIDDEVIGVIELLDKQGEATFSLHDLERLSDMAEPVAEAISLLPNTQPAATVIASRDTSPLFSIVNEISSYGTAELHTCRTMLESFAAYLHVRGAQPGDASKGTAQ